MELDRLYREAQAAEVAGDWRAAGSSLQQLVDLSPSYRDVQTRLETARTQCELADLYTEARQLSQAGEWQAVIKVFGQISSLDPSTPDPEGLLATANEQLAIQQKQAELALVYHRGVLALDAGRWNEAAGLLRRVREMQPGYEQSERLLERAEAEIARASATPAEPASLEAAAGAATVTSGPSISLEGASAAPFVAVTPEAIPAAPSPQAAVHLRIPAEWQAVARLTLRPALWLGVGWFLASLVAGLFFFDFQGNRLVNTINVSTGNALEYFDLQVVFTGLAGGLLCGMTLGLVLKRLDFNLARRQILALMVIWGSIILAVAALYAFSAPLQMLSWIIAGGLGGLLTYTVIRRTGADLNQQAQIWIILGWAIGLTVGFWFYVVFYNQYLFYWLKDNLLGEDIWSVTEWFIALGIGIAGLLGGLATFAVINAYGGGRTVQSRMVEAPEGSDTSS
jgi:tetratricopeptide (TPR) repeat protein